VSKRTEPITPGQFHDADGIEDWRVVGEGACAYFRTGSFGAGGRFVQAINGVGGLEGNRPDVDVRHGGVMVRLITITDDYYGPSEGHISPRPPSNRIHIDVWLPHDQAEARVAAAIAAGGHLVSDDHAPAWWTLADAEGNEVDVATWMPRANAEPR
jgi:hypothetical protein